MCCGLNFLSHFPLGHQARLAGNVANTDVQIPRPMSPNSKILKVSKPWLQSSTGLPTWLVLLSPLKSLQTWDVGGEISKPIVSLALTGQCSSLHAIPWALYLRMSVLRFYSVLFMLFSFILNSKIVWWKFYAVQDTLSSKDGNLTYCKFQAEGIWKMVCAGRTFWTSLEAGHKTPMGVCFPLYTQVRCILISENKRHRRICTDLASLLSYHIIPPLFILH